MTERCVEDDEFSDYNGNSELWRGSLDAFFCESGVVAKLQLLIKRPLVNSSEIVDAFFNISGAWSLVKYM